MDRRKTTAVAAAAVAAASIVASAAFDTPLEQTDPVPLVETVSPDGAEDAEGGQTEERRPGAFSRLRERVRAWPEEVRAALAGVPLWSAGQAVLAGTFRFLTEAAGPAVSHVLTWLLAAGIAVAVLGASVKAALPDVPVKEVLKPRNLFPLLGAAALLCVADLALCGFTEAAFPHWVWHLGAGGAMAAVCAVTIRREKRLALEEAERRAREPLTLEAVQEAARRLADSVCPARFT